MVNSKQSIRLLFAIMLLGIAIEALYFTHTLGDDFSAIFVSAVLVFFPSFYFIIFKSEQRLHLIAVISCSFFIFGMYSLYSLDFSYMPPVDAVFHRQVVQLILSEHVIPLGGGTGQAYVYSFYPAMHITVAAIAQVTGLDSTIILKLFTLTFILEPLFLYLIIKRMFKLDQNQSKIASVAALVGGTFVPGIAPSPTYSSFAGIFFLGVILTLFLHLEKPHLIRHLLICLILVFALGMTHHLTLYYILGFVCCFFIIQHVPIVKRIGSAVKSEQLKATTASLLVVFGILWPVFIAFAISAWQLELFVKWSSAAGLQKTYSVLGFYTLFEKIFIYSSMAFVIIMGLIGFACFIRKRTFDLRFLILVLYFGLLFFGLFALRGINETMENLSRRAIGFAFASAGPFVGYSLFAMSKHLRSKVQAIGLVILLCFAVSVVDLLPRGYYNFHQEDDIGQIFAMRKYGEKILASTKWSSKFLNNSRISLGDVPLTIYGIGYYQLNITVWNEASNITYWTVFQKPEKLQYILRSLSYYGVSYVYVDWLSARYFEEPTYRIEMPPLNDSNLAFVTNSFGTNCIYNNGLVQIQRINT